MLPPPPDSFFQRGFYIGGTSFEGREAALHEDSFEVLRGMKLSS